MKNMNVATPVCVFRMFGAECRVAMNVSDEQIFRAFLADRSDLRVDGQVDFVRFEEEAGRRKSVYGFNSRMSFGRIVYSKDGRHFRTESMAVKQTPAAFFDLHHGQQQFANEIHFYSKLLPFFDKTVQPKVDPFFPQFLYAFTQNSPAAEHSAMIFENLRDRGFEEHRRASGILLDYEHASLVMRRLGRFHGCSLAAARLDPHRLQQLAHFLPRIHELHLIGYWTLSQATLDYSVQLLAARDRSYAGKLQPFERISQNFVESLRNANKGTALEVVCHGDLFITNLLFSYEDGVPTDVRALDMGLWRMASPALDLAHVLYACVNQQTRDRHWDDLMADYRRGMAEVAGADHIPSAETIVEELRQHSWFAVMVASHCIRDQQARFQNSTRFFDVFGGVNLWAEDVSTEEIRKKLEEHELGGAVASEMIFNAIKDMIARNLI